MEEPVKSDPADAIPRSLVCGWRSYRHSMGASNRALD